MFPETVIGKEKMDTPVVITQGPEEGTKNNNKKYIIIGVSVVLVLAIIVGGLLGGMFLMHKSSSNMVEIINTKFTDRDGKQAKETVKVDIKNQVAETDVKKEGSEVKIISDLKRGVTVTRTTGKEGSACYVSILNKSAEMDLETMKKYKEQHPNPDAIEREVDDDEEQTFTVAEEAIKDISFLGDRVQEMCKGLNTYWMYPDNEKDNNMTFVEKKDGTRHARHTTYCSRLCPTYYAGYRLYACSSHRHYGRYCYLYCYHYRYFCYYRYYYSNGRLYYRRYCYRRNIRVYRRSYC